MIGKIEINTPINIVVVVVMVVVVKIVVVKIIIIIIQYHLSSNLPPITLSQLKTLYGYGVSDLARC